MNTTRCCAKCKNPYLSCRNTACKCHNKLADVIELIPQGGSDG